ncbi:hypothetical protein BU14_0392s0013 [Porphyra umbilicalis]|uniref:Uncharacterized protein n=1 Tax=Porphyra umbilicalis TaxID=2786 RepID=A0A1X6NWG8_PORUM|nr:hypothetical protein BU14_0392s0013 [Porphyra umbilicalis]|eukprot:OSX72954.1 hypothetical protein BU14_0392s0013 [Porphyra umbilicalis]
MTTTMLQLQLVCVTRMQLGELNGAKAGLARDCGRCEHVREGRARLQACRPCTCVRLRRHCFVGGGAGAAVHAWRRRRCRSCFSFFSTWYVPISLRLYWRRRPRRAP